MMIDENGVSEGSGYRGTITRIMDLNPRTIEMIRKFCDVGQIENAKFYTDVSFFWKNENTVITYNTENVKFYMSLPSGKTGFRQKLLRSALNNPRWREQTSTHHKYYGNPWSSPYRDDPRIRQ